MKIGILSRNSQLYSTRRLIQAAEDRGHEAEVIDHLKCNLVIEKNHPTVIYRGRNLDDIDAVIPRIGASVTFYGSAVVARLN